MGEEALKELIEKSEQVTGPVGDRTFTIREAVLLEFLREFQEDLEDARLLEAAMRNPEPSIPWEEVEKELREKGLL